MTQYPPMTFAEFAKIYAETFRRMMSYSPDEVGSSVYSEQLANLSDSHHAWAEIVENEAQ